MICPFCGIPAKWVENKAIYGKNFGRSFMMWLCKSCDAYVGCHNNTKEPLGTMANRLTREWRQKAHEVFDPLWKTGKHSRTMAYVILSRKMGKETHIGESDVETCKKIIKVLEDERG